MNSEISCIETKKIKNYQLLSNIIYKNFIYLTKFPDLMHNINNISNILQLDSNITFLLYFQDILIGYLVGDFRILTNNNDNRFVYYISYIYVSQKYQNKKFGSTLLNFAIKKCVSKNIKFILLTCDSFDSKVMKFYHNHGFILDPLLGNNTSRHVVLCKYL